MARGSIPVSRGALAPCFGVGSKLLLADARHLDVVRPSRFRSDFCKGTGVASVRRRSTLSSGMVWYGLVPLGVACATLLRSPFFSRPHVCVCVVFALNVRLSQGYGGRASTDVTLQGLIRSVRGEEASEMVTSSGLRNPGEVIRCLLRRSNVQRCQSSPKFPGHFRSRKRCIWICRTNSSIAVDLPQPLERNIRRDLDAVPTIRTLSYHPNGSSATQLGQLGANRNRPSSASGPLNAFSCSRSWRTFSTAPW